MHKERLSWIIYDLNLRQKATRKPGISCMGNYQSQVYRLNTYTPWQKTHQMSGAGYDNHWIMSQHPAH